jgi:site-specific recombinase XerD
MYLRKTKDLAGLQKLLGHYSINNIMKYAHVMEDEVRDSIKVLISFKT